MKSSARPLATLVPALLCVLWSLLLAPAADASARGAATPAAPTVSAQGLRPSAASAHGLAASGASGASAQGRAAAGTTPQPPSDAAPRARSQEPRLAPAAVVGLPVAVENPVRFPAPPAAPPVAQADLSVPARGLLVGDPRRERAPPGGVHRPRASRGPPSTRHS
ncbi:hypothetical protein [Streptomyces nymphaeiformis]|uniref:Uncharacterized protein n=1 Tax=Streptomyces nymphaeiformis TaxID=2663842 RepID=A0A7W7TZB8_9ACTN|nr:hypothetical protein [Streptomyces nymphaeiformis]MBB4981267.1 hypothetical protein [Streptomyces nymphaeiformis]